MYIVFEYCENPLLHTLMHTLLHTFMLILLHTLMHIPLINIMHTLQYTITLVIQDLMTDDLCNCLTRYYTVGPSVCEEVCATVQCVRRGNKCVCQD